MVNGENLDHELEQEIQDLFLVTPKDEGYALVTDRLHKLYKVRSDELLEEKRLKFEIQQAKENKKQNSIRIVVDLAAIVLPLVVYIGVVNKGFYFEEHGSITSSTFRNVLQKFRPFR